MKCSSIVEYPNHAYAAPQVKKPNFSNGDLKGLELFSAWLPSVDFSGADLRETDLSMGNFIGANFKNAKMINASLHNALLDKADFSNADLRGVNLRSARMHQTIFKNTNLNGSIYDDATIFPQGFNPDMHGLIKQEGPNKRKIRKRPSDELLKSNFIEGLPSNTELHGIGTYNSFSKKRGGFREHPQGTMDAHIKKKDVPLFLVLTAYEPTLWHLHIDEGVNLQGVIISGMHEQDISGLPRGVSLYNYSLKSTNLYKLKFYSTKRCGKEFDKMVRVIKGVTGKTLSSFQVYRRQPGSPQQSPKAPYTFYIE